MTVAPISPPVVAIQEESGAKSLAPDVSVVITVFNELGSLPELRNELVAALDGLGRTWEVILVDDGSNDGSREFEREICEADSRFRAVILRRNFGKAAALHMGFREARGAYVVTMDADLQDDPADIGRFLEPLDRGDADMVTGWKFPRRDPLSKRLPSKVYNLAVRVSTGLRLHDMNCGFKAYRSCVTRDLNLYGDMHRYIPVLATGAGFIVSEVKTNHRARQHGHSKYAAGRFVRGFLDLLTVLFLTQYRRRPLHLIGGLGLGMGMLGFGILLYLTAVWFSGEAIGGRPLLFLGILLMLVAGQFFTFGLLAEMMAWQNRREHSDYAVLKTHNLDHPSAPHRLGP